MPGCAPGRVTEKAAAAQAKAPASSSLRPSASAAANAPLKAQRPKELETTSAGRAFREKARGRRSAETELLRVGLRHDVSVVKEREKLTQPIAA